MCQPATIGKVNSSFYFSSLLLVKAEGVKEELRKEF